MGGARRWLQLLGLSSCKDCGVNSFFLFLEMDLNLKLGYDRMRSTTPSSTFSTPMTLTMLTTATRSASSRRGRLRSPRPPSPRSCSSSSKPPSSSCLRRLEPVPPLTSPGLRGRGQDREGGGSKEFCYPNCTPPKERREVLVPCYRGRC